MNGGIQPMSPLANPTNWWRSNSPLPSAAHRRAATVAVLLLGLSPFGASANDLKSERLSGLQRIMPTGAICSDLSWEPVSYCRFHSKGATLEIWSGVYGLGASLGFDSPGR